MIYKQILARKDYLEKEIDDVLRKLDGAPKENLVVGHDRKYLKYYASDGKHLRYLKKAERDYAVRMAYKKYYKEMLADYQSELDGINGYLKAYNINKHPFRDMISIDSPYHDLLKAEAVSASDDLITWQNSPYPKCESHPENLRYKTVAGCVVRSKSEAMIATALYNAGIPFRYENPLDLDGNIMYPDFTMRHPISGQYCYWEHYGLMDKPDYIETTLFKQRALFHHGILPDINLITTYETSEHPLDPLIVEKKIKVFLES